MAAVVSVVQQAGEDYGEGNKVAKTIFYFLSQDSNTLSPLIAPLRIPTSGTRFSYEIYLLFRLDVAPASKVFNFKIWTTSLKPSNIDITINSSEVTEYTQPTNLQSSKGTRVSLYSYTSSLNSRVMPDELINIGDESSYLVLQLEVSSLSTPQELNNELIFSYDEI